MQSAQQVSQPRPKALALTLLVDWFNDNPATAANAAAAAADPSRVAHVPDADGYFLCVHFGPPPAQPGAPAAANTVGTWQFTMEVYSALRPPAALKKLSEEAIAKENRALLMYHNPLNHIGAVNQFGRAVVVQHCQFPTEVLTPRVIAFHADRAEPEANALVSRGSCLQVVHGHIYHLHFTFPDGSLVNRCIAPPSGWGFTASLFSYKLTNGNYVLSQLRAVTQIRANWLDVVEPDPTDNELNSAAAAAAATPVSQMPPAQVQSPAAARVPHTPSATPVPSYGVPVPPPPYQPYHAMQAQQAPAPAQAPAAAAAAPAAPAASRSIVMPTPSDNPRPKSLALTMLVDWSQQKLFAENAAAGAPVRVSSSKRPAWLCVHFGPKQPAQPNTPQAAHYAEWNGRVQFTMNIYSADRSPLTLQRGREAITKESRAILLNNSGVPYNRYSNAVVAQHTKFPNPQLTPRVVAFHADRAEPEANALVWRRRIDSEKQRKEDSCLEVASGHIYHLHWTFPDGSYINSLMALGWGFTASLFTYKRRDGKIIVSPSRAVTQIRANWLDVIEADPSKEEVEEARLASLAGEAAKKSAAAWTISDLNVVLAPGDTGSLLPSYDALRALGSEYKLRSDVLCNFKAEKDREDLMAAARLTPAGSTASKSEQELLLVVGMLDQRARCVAADSSNRAEFKEFKDSATRLVQILKFSAQLYGWRIIDDHLNPRPMAAAAAAPKRKFDVLSELNENIVLNTMLRAKWILEIEKKNSAANKYASDEGTLNRIMGVLLKDNKWRSDTLAFLTGMEAEIKRLTSSNPVAFAACRKVIASVPAQWPHSERLKLEIERAGFVYRPSLIERDRILCRTCGVEFSGLRPWHNTLFMQQMHDWRINHPGMSAPRPSASSGAAYCRVA